MKRFLAILLVLSVMLFSVACDNGQTPPPTEQPGGSTEVIPGGENELPLIPPA